MVVTKQLRIILGLLVLLSLPVGAVGSTADSWHIRINIPEYRLYLYHGTELYRSFYVAVGKSDSPSPIGSFWVINKVLNPTWYPSKRQPVPPGPNNPLGKYWLGLNRPGYGIHGNNAEWSIGSPVSQGCFRMYNHDIEVLFNLVLPGTPVEIEYRTVVGEMDEEHRVWLTLFPDIYRIDPPGRVEQVISALNWEGEPHWKSLDELLKHKRPTAIEVPRLIRLDGDLLGNDGFYWNQEFYSNGLPATVPASDFPGYQPLKALADFEAGQWKLIWYPEHDTLEVYRFKVLLNGKIIAGAAGRKTADRLELNRRLIGPALNLEPESIPAQNGQSGTTGSVANFDWIPLDVLTSTKRGLRYDWDETTWTLRLKTETKPN